MRLPTAAQALRFDPGELPCCITNLSFSDDRLLCVPANGLTLPGDSILFLGDDPNFRLEGLTHYPAGMKLVVSYCYFPAGDVDGRAPFNAVLEGVQHFQKTWNSEARHIQQLEQANAEQQQAVDALHKNIAELHQANAELTARCQAYEKIAGGGAVQQQLAHHLTVPPSAGLVPPQPLSALITDRGATTFMYSSYSPLQRTQLSGQVYTDTQSLYLLVYAPAAGWRWKTPCATSSTRNSGWWIRWLTRSPPPWPVCCWCGRMWS